MGTCPSATCIYLILRWLIKIRHWPIDFGYGALHYGASAVIDIVLNYSKVMLGQIQTCLFTVADSVVVATLQQYSCCCATLYVTLL